METSILLAKIIGPVLLVVGVGILANLEHYRGMVQEFVKSPFKIYLSAILALILGMLIVRFHNVWQWRWPVLITLLGWASVLKGIVRIVAPAFIRSMAERFTQSSNAIAVSGAFAFLLGAVLTYFAYFPGV